MRRVTLVAALCLVPLVASGGYRASTFKKETRLGANYWNASAAVDGDFESCWQVDPEQENEGQWIEIDIPASTVDKIAAVIGWQKSEESFRDHTRIKTVRVLVFDGAADNPDKPVHEQSITFPDELGWQILDVENVRVGDELSGGKVRLVVTEVYPGDDYPALAVSEVLVHLEESDAVTALGEPPAPSAEANPPDLLLDGDPKKFWLSADDGPGQTFTLQASGFGLASVGFFPGPQPHARPRTVEITIKNSVLRHELKDVAEWQHVMLPQLSGYTGSSWGTVEVKVIDVYPGKAPGMAIGEVKLRSTTYEGL